MTTLPKKPRKSKPATLDHSIAAKEEKADLLYYGPPELALVPLPDTTLDEQIELSFVIIAFCEWEIFITLYDWTPEKIQEQQARFKRDLPYIRKTLGLLRRIADKGQMSEKYASEWKANLSLVGVPQ